MRHAIGPISLRHRCMCPSTYRAAPFDHNTYLYAVYSVAPNTFLPCCLYPLFEIDTHAPGLRIRRCRIRSSGSSPLYPGTVFLPILNGLDPAVYKNRALKFVRYPSCSFTPGVHIQRERLRSIPACH